MKIIGIVKEFDNYNGIILGLDDKEYKLMDKELLSDVNMGDIVIFDGEKIENDTLNINVARFIKKIDITAL